MKVRIAAISDIHAAGCCAVSSMRGDIADVLLLRAVHYVNRLIKPDVTLVLGDIVDDGFSPSAQTYLRQAGKTLQLLHSPFLVIPGNHDGDSDSFYRVFPHPDECVAVKGVRFLVFLDPQEPGFNARRTDADLGRIKAARIDYSGSLISVQHVPLFPPGASDCPYNFTNAERVISVMKSCGVALAISGHYHRGMALLKADNVSFVAAPALCEWPFRFLQIDIEEQDIFVTEHQLAVPPELELVDCHVHTELAYCSENMEVRRVLSLAKDFNLAGVGFSEHTAQLYFDVRSYESCEWLTAGLGLARAEQSRMDKYFELLARAGCEGVAAGLEADCDAAGRLLLKDSDRERAAFVVGAIHNLVECRGGRCDAGRAGDEFLARLKRLLGCGIQVLAHPFRVFCRAGLSVDRRVREQVVQMLKDANVAAEINFHTYQPEAEFVKLCLKAGVKLSLGSDAHNLYEVGFFAPHLQFLRACGYNADIRDILVDPRQGGCVGFAQQ
jgi:histidinol phosphatase-like PHP family hydrolase/calcineurin-like phosphoesterase family protein